MLLRQSLVVLLTLCAPLAGPRLSAQAELLTHLADSLCVCLERATAGPERAAPACLRSVLLTERVALRKRYDLDVANPRQRSYVAEQLTDLLIDRCALLATYQPAALETENRWSDLSADRTTGDRPAPAHTSPKGPPPPADRPLGEPPPEYRLSGTLLARPGQNGLRLRTAGGTTYTFELPTAVTRKRDFRAGQVITLSYRREWRPAAGRVVLVVVAIDEP